jgi:hypothetical protein
MPKGIQKRTIDAFNILATLLACMVTKKLSISPGKAMFNWLYAIGAQQPKWFLGSLANRNRFGAWIAFLARGLADPDFLLKFQGTTDVWERSKLVGMRISAIRKQFAELSDAQKEELGRTSEAEFKAGVAMLGRDKSLVMSLVQITDPPAQE